MKTVVILYGTSVVGEAKIQRQGLYYQFCCSCNFSESRIYKLWATSGGKNIKLGVCVPEMDCYTLCRKIPIAHFDTDEISVYALNDNEAKTQRELDTKLVSIKRLDQAILRLVDGHQVVCIKD